VTLVPKNVTAVVWIALGSVSPLGSVVAMLGVPAPLVTSTPLFAVVSPTTVVPLA
jgi:hypothetical protein